MADLNDVHFAREVCRRIARQASEQLLQFFGEGTRPLDERYMDRVAVATGVMASFIGEMIGRLAINRGQAIETACKVLRESAESRPRPTVSLAAATAEPEPVLPLRCPKCGARDIEETTMGWQVDLGQLANPNRATCGSCAHHGTVGDWHLIASLRAASAKAPTA